MKEFLSLNLFLSVLHNKQELPASYEHALKSKLWNNPKFKVLLAELEMKKKRNVASFFY